MIYFLATDISQKCEILQFIPFSLFTSFSLFIPFSLSLFIPDRIYKCLFSGSFSAILTLPLDLLSTDNLVSDGFYGCCVVTCTLCAFISLVWLREQILRGGGPEWLDQQHLDAQVNGDGNLVNNNNQGEENPDGDDDANFEDIPDEEGVEVVDENGDGANGDGANGDGANGNGANGNEQNIVEGEDLMNPDVAINAAVEGVVNGGAAQDDIGWNQVEWDRAAEELTWERILGLDGSLVFLEHVFWVISLNTLFIFVFAFCPYHIGQVLLVKTEMNELASASQFEGLVTTVSGYIVIGLCLVLLHFFTSILRFKKTERILGLCYVVVKVSLLSVFEIGVFPLVCGWWLDICSLVSFRFD